MTQAIELWGGLECTVNRVLDVYFNQMQRSGHSDRKDDLDRFASLGIKAIRYPVLWETTAPETLEKADWTWPDERLQGLQKLGITPIVGLVHHGSGPSHTNLLEAGFAEGLAAFAGAVARRYPWITAYTPVNEPLTTARFSGLYGLWYPHGRSDHSFIKALLNQCRGIVLSMRAIRRVNPDAALVQTDDLGKTFSTPQLASLADLYNERRWLGWDLLCGKVDASHALWRYLTGTGIAPSELLWFQDNPCPPDIIGVNYYITSERWLDHRLERYPQRYAGRYLDYHCVDIETPRVLATPSPGISPLLQEAWERYGITMAVTEAHIDANREDQLRWLLEIWDGAKQAQRNGVDMRAITVWALLGSYDWNCLVTECNGYYEPGPFDVRTQPPRPTAVAHLMRELASGRRLSSPVLQGEGWWRRPGRFFCPPIRLDVVTDRAPAPALIEHEHTQIKTAPPILIVGATGTLGQTFARLCASRNLAFRLVGRQEMDITNPAAIEYAIARYQPWAIINAGGYVRVDDAEREPERCFHENAQGPAVLAISCIRHGIGFMTFSSDLVFDGAQQWPYVETDTVAPLSIYGQSKVQAERRVLDAHPDALVVRTSAFFDPWDSSNFVTVALHALARNVPLEASGDMTVSPTYVPDLVNASLDLLIDKEKGLWHLTNADPITWADFALKASAMAGIDSSSLKIVTSARQHDRALRPRYSALRSERGILLPSLEHALARYLQVRARERNQNEPGAAPNASG